MTQLSCRRESLASGLSMFASALSRKAGITLEFGRHAGFDGSTMTVPMPRGMTQEEVDETLAAIFHECGHARYTDMAAFLTGSKTAFERALDNSLEDARIESLIVRDYMGAERLFKAYHGRSIERIASRRLPLAEAVALYVLACGWKRLIGRPWAAPLEEAAGKRVEKAFGGDLTRRIALAAEKVSGARSMQDCQEIRREIVALLESETVSPDPPPQLPPRPGDGSRGGSGQEGTPAPPPPEGNPPGGGNRGSLPDETPSSRQDTASGGNCQAGGCRAEKESLKRAEAIRRVLATGKDISSPFDLSKKYRKLASSSGGNAVSFGRIDLTGAVRARPADDSRAGARGRRRLLEARIASVALRRSLSAIVESRASAETSGARSGRRIDSRHISRLFTGDPAFFVGDSDERAPNTAVHLLLDLSGSMDGGCDETAIRAALALLAGLQDIQGVNPALSVFPGHAGWQRDYAAVPVMRHGERLESVNPAVFGSLRAFGGTPAEEALSLADAELASCREPKKVVILITDGDFYECGDAVASLRSHGVRVIGVGIGRGCTLPALPDGSLVIGDARELKDALFAFARRILS